jgi:hypothetical protein
MTRATRSKDEQFTAEISVWGRNAWVLQQLETARGNGAPEAVVWIIDQWVNSLGQKHLMDSYGIDIRTYRRPSKVTKISDKRRDGGN